MFGCFKKQTKKQIGAQIHWMSKPELDAFTNAYAGREENNAIISKSVNLSLDYRKTGQNANTLVTGAVGMDNIYHFIVPNILQKNCNMVISDPGGLINRQYSPYLKDNGYEIKRFNLDTMKDSIHYNPLAHIKTEEDVQILASIISNMPSADYKKRDTAYQKYEELFLSACIAYLIAHSGKEVPSLYDVYDLCQSGQNDNRTDNLDDIFLQTREDNPGSYAESKYRAFKETDAEFQKDILTECSRKLAEVTDPKVKELLMSDDFDFNDFINRKTVLFLEYSTCDMSLCYLHTIMQAQLCAHLYRYCQAARPDCSCPHHVRFFLDDLRAFGRIPGFAAKTIAAPGHNVSATIFVQSIRVLQRIYPEEWEVIVSNCGAIVGKNLSIHAYTANWIAQTIAQQQYQNKTMSRQKQEEAVESIRKELMSFKTNELVVLLHGQKPLKDKCLKTHKHPGFKYVAKK